MSMPLSFFMWSMNGQTRVISGMKKRETSTRNLHIVKNVNESLNISSLQIFPVFDRFRLLTLAWSLADKKLRRELKQSLELIVLAGLFSVVNWINITKSCSVYFATYGCKQITGRGKELKGWVQNGAKWRFGWKKKLWRKVLNLSMWASFRLRNIALKFFSPGSSFFSRINVCKKRLC